MHRYTREHFEAGEDVFRQGDVGDRIYFVIDGEGDVVIDGVATHVIEAGGVSGEIALIANSTAHSNCACGEPASNMASFSRETFHTLVAHFPGVKTAMDELLAKHLAADHKRRSVEASAASH